MKKLTGLNKEEVTAISRQIADIVYIQYIHSFDSLSYQM